MNCRGRAGLLSQAQRFQSSDMIDLLLMCHHVVCAAFHGRVHQLAQLLEARLADSLVLPSLVSEDEQQISACVLRACKQLCIHATAAHPRTELF